MAEVFKGLVDHRGQPIRKQQLTVEQAAPTTRHVRQTNAMHPAEGLTPRRLGSLLRESIDGDPEAYLALAEDMEERDLHYAGVLSIRKRQVAGLEITVEAAEEDDKSIAHADLVRAAIQRDGFEDELIDMLDAIGKGFSLTEIIWDTSERQWMPKALKWRDPRLFTFDPTDGETPLLVANEGKEPLRPYQWIYHTAKVKSGLAIRGGIARAVAWAFLFKAFTMKDWAIFCEAYGHPLRLGKYGPGATEADKKVLMNAVASIGADFAAIIPASMEIAFEQASISGSHELYERRSDFLDRQVSKVVLGQTGTTDAIAGGHAVGRVHDQVREDIERSDARQLQATLNRDLVMPLIDLNFGRQAAYPKIRIGRPDELDVSKLTQNVTRLVPLGLKVSASFMRDRLGIPDPEDGEELLTAPARKAPTVLEPADVNDATTAAHSARGPLDQDAIEVAIEDMLAAEGWEAVTAPIIGDLEARIRNARSLEEAQRIVADHYGRMDVTALAELLARSGFASQLAGLNEDEL